MTSQLSFEHFDPELELGSLDEQGRPIRPRKKPGRKPNPPSPAQRKAQNRAAQRAFRERKRREMHDAEVMVKRCMHLRDQALEEVSTLRQKVSQLMLENNYLKGYTLTLKLACLANGVDVPKLWDARKKDALGCDKTTFSKTKGIPQSLEIFLDRNKRIISLEDDQLDAEDKDMLAQCAPPSVITDLYSAGGNAGSPVFSSSSSHSESSCSASVHLNSLPTPACTEDTTSSMMQDVVEHSERDTSLDVASIAPLLANHLESPFFQRLLSSDVGSSLLSQRDVDDNVQHTRPSPSPPLNLLAPTLELDSMLPSAGLESWLQDSTDKTTPSSKAFDMDLSLYLNDSATESSMDDDSQLISEDVPFNDYPEDSLVADVSNSDTRDTKQSHSIGPMDARTLLKMLKDIGKDPKTLFTPTELQRAIPHDPRIDVIPGPAMRDLLILYQNYYDADRLFNGFLESATFLGGEIGNPDCWYTPFSLLEKHWFLLPNHKPKRSDNLAETMISFGQRLTQKMFERKRMYIEREKYSHHFPSGCDNSPFPPQNDLLFMDSAPGNPWHFSTPALALTVQPSTTMMMRPLDLLATNESAAN